MINKISQPAYLVRSRYLYQYVSHICFLSRKQAQAAKMEAEKEGIVVPVTLEDYCIKTRARPAEQQLDMTDFYDDEYELDDDEDEQLSATDYEDGDDSGNGES